MLRFVIGDCSSFNNENINIETDRKSIDGTKVMKHIELLTDEEFDAIRFNQEFTFISNDALYELLDTPEWKLPEE